MDIIINLLIILLLLVAAYFLGTAIEKSNYEKIQKREKEFLNLPAVTSKNIEAMQDILSAEIVMGSIVVSIDYFKRFLAGLRNIVGGRIKSYETLLDRGRREAILRMKESAKAKGADIILNMRFETSAIGVVTQKKGSIGCFEVLAYGTAVQYKK